jgi:hypothetical protein
MGKSNRSKKPHWTRNAMLVSIVIHAVVLLAAGGLVVSRIVQKDAVNFVGEEVERPKMKLRRLEVPVEVKKMQQRQKPQLQQRLIAAGVAQRAMPEIKMPERRSGTGVGDGFGGGTSLGEGLGGSLGFGVSSVNFFGIKSSGESVFFLVDASQLILVDEKGGIPAYTKVKEELANMIGRLSPATLFNIAFFHGWNQSNVNLFSQQMLSATEENVQRVARWAAPINKEFNLATIGPGRNNYQPKKGFEPMQNPMGLTYALMAAFERQPDTLFIICARWSPTLRQRTEREEREYQKYITGPDHVKYWTEPRQKTFEYFNKLNEERRKKGLPPRVDINWRVCARTVLKLDVRDPPYLHVFWTFDDNFKTIRNAFVEYYRKEDKKPPVINIIAFAGEDEKDDKAHWAGLQNNWKNLEELAKSTRGSFRILYGLKGIEMTMVPE